MDPKREARKLELENRIADLNDSSPECLSACDELRIIRLEDENAKLREAVDKVGRTCCIIDAHLICRAALKP